MKRVLFSGMAVLVLAACEPEIPDSGAGINDYFSGSKPAPATNPDPNAAVPPANAVSDETSPEAASLDNSGGEAAGVAAATTAVLADSEPTVENGVKVEDGVVQATPDNPAPPILDNPGISDENDFEAVGARRTIEDDAARIAANSENYTVVAATAVPKRVETGPNIVEFALSGDNPIGNRIYNRVGFNAESRYERNCAKYRSGDQAQQAFLERGGPKRDRMGLDPDGDGYACDWDPAPYRRAKGN